MNEMAKIRLPEFPCKANLYDFTKFLPFADSDEGKEAFERHRKTIKNTNTFKIVVWAILVAVVLILFLTNHPFFGILVVVFGGSAAVGLTIDSSSMVADARLNQDIAKYCGRVAEDVMKNSFKGAASYFYYRTDALIYNDVMCAYLSIDKGDFIVYSKSNIKDVIRERVHVGTQSTTVGTTTGKSRKTFANMAGFSPFGTREHKITTTFSTSTREIYEWHFDIFTDFMPYPRVSIILPDGKWAENETGKAYGILKP